MGLKLAKTSGSSVVFFRSCLITATLMDCVT